MIKLTDNPHKNVESMLSDVQPEHQFRLNSGNSLKNIAELYSALLGMDDSVFQHHVNSERNDFANWVREVHKDYKLANNISQSSTRDETAKAVSQRIYEARKSAAKPAYVTGEYRSSREQSVEILDKRLSLMLVPEPARNESKPAPSRPSEDDNAIEAVEKLAQKIMKEHASMPGSSTSRPSRQCGPRQSSEETASERLERILSDAAKAKLASDESKIVSQKTSETPVFALSDPDTQKFLFGETEAVSQAVTINDQEEKGAGFMSRLGSDLSGLFSRDTISTLTSDIKGMLPESRPVSNFSAPPAKLTEDPHKERMISHLKKVYK